MSTVSDTLITDRTVDDLADDTDRAYMAHTDLDRVGQACALLAGPLHVDIRIKEWRMEDFRTDTEIARLLGDIKVLRVAYFTKTNTSVVPVRIIYSSVYQANDIEQILKGLRDMHNSMASGRQRLSFKLGAKAIGNRR